MFPSNFVESLEESEGDSKQPESSSLENINNQLNINGEEKGTISYQAFTYCGHEKRNVFITLLKFWLCLNEIVKIYICNVYTYYNIRYTNFVKDLKKKNYSFISLSRCIQFNLQII